MAITGIDHVQVAAPPGCEAEARAFYGGLLGLEELPKPEALRARGGCWFRAGAQELHVGVEEPFSPARKAHPGLVVDDLDALSARLGAAGIDLSFDDGIPGARRAHVSDPFGNRLELRQR
jgi:catechol 2,3-dioxygenase-like lactoylglutathione lyase family enzyme